MKLTSSRRMERRIGSGFTLIELLIVVAIIAILALIAVPNFLEAQTRAKVSRSKTDLRTLAVGIECYRLDNNEWPIGPQDPPSPTWQDFIPKTNPNWWDWRGYSVEFGQWFHLTTPIAYLTSIPHDAFKKAFNEQWRIWEDYYRFWNISQKPTTSGWGWPSTYYAKKNGVQVLMASVGPDGVEDVSNGDQGGKGMSGVAGMVLYDPTNGTVSWGDVYYGLPGIGFDIQQKILGP